MPLCVFDDSNAMFGSTPVDNLFLEEFMPLAPGDCVKVYLYGLKLCQSAGREMTLSAVARALALEEEQVLKAFGYWERKGLLRRLSDRPPSYAYVNLQRAVMEGKLGGRDQALPYQEFNGALQDLFGDRLLHAEEYQRLYAIVEDLGIPQDVLLLLVDYMIRSSPRKRNVTLKQIEREAQFWVSKGYTTRESAQDYIHSKEAVYEGARQVLRQMGQRRAPSLDEEALYQRWTEEMGFSLEAILLACKETTKISAPNFAYVDSVLTNRYKRGAIRPDQAAEAERQRAERVQGLRQVLESLGLPASAATQDNQKLYSSWLQAGFDQEALVFIARYMLRRGDRHDLDAFSAMLERFRSKGLFKGEELQEKLQAQGRSERELDALFRAADIRRRPTDADIQQLESWKKQGASMELMLLAAEYSRHAENPFAMMQKILSGWLEASLRDVESARRDHEQRRQAAAARPTAGGAPKTSAWLDYSQRSYTKEEYEAMYDDLDALFGDEPKEPKKP